MTDYIKVKNEEIDHSKSMFNKSFSGNPEELLSTLSPIIYLHSQEKYFPSSVDYYLENSKLVEISNGVKTIKDENPSQRDIYNFCLNSLDTLNKNIYLDIPKSNIFGENPQKKSIPIYAYIDKKQSTDNELHLVYVMFYPYNGEFKILGLEDKGTHFGDIEHITIVLTRNNSENANKPVYKLDKIFFGAHGDLDGRWVNAENVEFENDKPVIYAAYHSHATYPKAGSYFRIYGLANDNTDKGVRWVPSVQRIYTKDEEAFNPDTMGWVYFCGLWGEDGINSLRHKTFFEKGEPKQEDLKSPTYMTQTKWKLIKSSVILLGALILVLIGIKGLKSSNKILFFSLYFLILALIPIITKNIIKKVNA